MTTPFWCLFIGCLIPYLLAPVAGYYKVQKFDSLDNKNPRAQTAALEGAGARASAAQSNAWEALAVFAAAVLVNHANGGDPGTSATLALERGDRGLDLSTKPGVVGDLKGEFEADDSATGVAGDGEGSKRGVWR